MPGGRRGRVAVAVLCTALGIVLAYLGSGAVHPAKSARTTHLSGPALAHVQVRKTPRDAYLTATATHKHLRKARVARKRATAYGIAVFGDSVSVGYGASDRDRGYVARVSRWLHTHGKRVRETVNAKGGVPVGYWTYAPMPRRLDAAVVELGTNDVRLGTPSAQFAHEYRTLTSRIRAANPHAQLLCLSVWSHPAGASLDRVINAQIRAVCPGTYVDITGLRNHPNIRSSDGFHPNDRGYRLIARAIESKLKTS